MKLHFDANLDYQLDSINAVVDVFQGQPYENGSSKVLDVDEKQMSIEQVSARGNALRLTDEQIINNVHSIQDRNMLERSEINPGGFEFPVEFPLEISTPKLQHGLNFSIEMETGTGKTYVYLRTIHELHQHYGWKKFIIVVPSVAIREGVLKNLEITREHFDELYHKPEMDPYVWDSKKTGQAREFATNDTLQIMVITIDSFAKAANIMNKQSDYGRPLDFVRATNPVVILDEPQNMETEVRKAAIESLNPLCTLRYSATHKNPYNLLYRLTPVDAYDKHLVKKIEVHSVLSEDSYNDAYVNVVKLERKGKSRIIAHVEIDTSDARGLQRRVAKVSPGDDLAEMAGRAVYENYVVERIDFVEQAVEFANGKTVYVGQKNEGLRDCSRKIGVQAAIELGCYDIVSSDLVSEGGDREFNGAGVLIAIEDTEVRKRNPEYSKEQIEEAYKKLWNVGKIIWLPQPMVDDDDFRIAPLDYKADGTPVVGSSFAAHSDEMCRFIGRNKI